MIVKRYDKNLLKFLETPVGCYFKISFPKYFARKVPHDASVEIEGDSIKLTIKEEDYKNKDFYIFEKIIHKFNQSKGYKEKTESTP